MLVGVGAEEPRRGRSMAGTATLGEVQTHGRSPIVLGEEYDGASHVEGGSRQRRRAPVALDPDLVMTLLPWLRWSGEATSSLFTLIDAASSLFRWRWRWRVIGGDGVGESQMETKRHAGGSWWENVFSKGAPYYAPWKMGLRNRFKGLHKIRAWFETW
jgi:hypothetical protein